MKPRRNPSRSRKARGLSLVETLFAATLLGVLAVATLTAAGQAAASRVGMEEQSRGMAWANSLLAEICALPYEDASPTGLLGPETGETNAAADRLTLDDVDDYGGLLESVPSDKSGVTLDSGTGWRREVEVAWIEPSDPSVVSVVETGVKRVLVRVYHGTKLVSRVSAVRSRAWDEMVGGG